MKLITEQQIEALISHLSELPLKYNNYLEGPINLLKNLPNMQENKEPELTPTEEI